MTDLYNFHCEQNQIKELILDNNINLETLSCYSNQIPNLSLEDCVSLKRLQCTYNDELELLDVSSAKQLEYLSAICKNLKYVYLPVGFVLNVENGTIPGFSLWNETAGEFTEEYHMLGYQYPEFRWK